MKSKVKYLLISLTVVLFIGLTILANYMYTSARKIMPMSHVYVCDNPAEDSEFDVWMKNELGLNWVPTYLIIRNDYVIGTIRGGIPESQFTSELGTILINNWQIAELPNIEISNVNGERQVLADVLPNNDSFYILEISWIDCPDCIFQDENFTEDVYLEYGTNIIYRYYIHSTQEEVLAKYE